MKSKTIIGVALLLPFGLFLALMAITFAKQAAPTGVLDPRIWFAIGLGGLITCAIVCVLKKK